MPELAPLVVQAAERPDRVTQGQVEILQRGTRRILLVRISAASNAGAVVTFDDVTDLMSAQRMAAWGDVARRIAHEIKTPADADPAFAERLKRALPEADQGRSGDLLDLQRHDYPPGRRHRPPMVDEFSSSPACRARRCRPRDAKELCQQALFLQRNGNPEIRYVSTLPDHAVAADLRSPPDRAGVDEYSQEFGRGHRGQGSRSGPGAAARRDHAHVARRGQHRAHCRRGQRQRLAARGPRAPHRAVHWTDAQQRHRPRSRRSSRRSWKITAVISRWTIARVAVRASVWYSGVTRRKSRRLDRMRQPHNDPQITRGQFEEPWATIFSSSTTNATSAR